MTVSQKAWKTGGSKMFIRVDTQVPVEDLIKGMIVQSGNDACVALAEAIAGSEESFAQMMNREAKRLGHECIELHQFDRPARSAAVHDGARPGDAGRRR